MKTDRKRRLLEALLFAEKMASELEDYIARKELFRQLIVHTPWGDELPKMSLGGLVERLRYLERHEEELSAEERERLHAVREAYEELLRYHRQEVEERFRREFKSFLGSWKWYLDDLRDNPRKAADYPGEVHNRVRLTTLLQEAQRLGVDLGADNVKQLEQLDAWLREHWEPGPFNWPGHNPEDYDPDVYWYLYGKPKV